MKNECSEAIKINNVSSSNKKALQASQTNYVILCIAIVGNPHSCWGRCYFACSERTDTYYVWKKDHRTITFE
jgi:hypothetical protein